MSLQTRIGDLITAIGTDVKGLRTMITGSNTTSLAGLTTTTKASIIAAINEVHAKPGPSAASETVAGILETATQPETNAGTDDARAVTPLKFHTRLLAYAQPLHANLTTLAGVASGVFGRTLLGSADAAAARTSLGLAAVATSGSASDITTGTLPSSVLPALAINEVFVVASQAAMLALAAQRGDIAKRTDLNGQSFVLSADAPGTLANWIALDTTNDVSSVNGQTGVVVLAKGDVGLGNVDNTSDVNKPVSTAQQTALDGKQPIDADLTAIAGLASVADRVPYSTGPQAWALATFTAAGRALVDDVDAAAQRTTLSVYSQADIGNPETDLVALYTTAKA